MNKPTRQIKIFLIHSHGDRESTHRLYQRMIRDGFDAWLDVENLQPGQEWQREIRRAILQSDAILACLSRGFDKQQGFRHEELRIALEKARWMEDAVFIIPVRLERCDMPESLQHLHRVDLFKPGGYKKLARALQEQRDARQSNPRRHL